MQPGLGRAVGRVADPVVGLHEHANPQFVRVGAGTDIESHRVRKADPEHLVAGGFPVVLDTLDTGVVGRHGPVLFLDIRDAGRGAGADRRRLEPDSHHVAGRRRIVAEVLHATAEADADLGVDAAALDVGLGDETGSRRCFCGKQEERQHNGRGRTTC